MKWNREADLSFRGKAVKEKTGSVGEQHFWQYNQHGRPSVFQSCDTVRMAGVTQ